MGFIVISNECERSFAKSLGGGDASLLLSMTSSFRINMRNLVLFVWDSSLHCVPFRITFIFQEILQGKAFQNDMCFSLRCFTAAQHDNQMLFRVYTKNLLFLFATVMIESFLLYEILHITAFCSEWYDCHSEQVRGIPGYYCMRFFGVSPLRMTFLLSWTQVRDLKEW